MQGGLVWGVRREGCGAVRAGERFCGFCFLRSFLVAFSLYTDFRFLRLLVMKVGGVFGRWDGGLVRGGPFGGSFWCRSW